MKKISVHEARAWDTAQLPFSYFSTNIYIACFGYTFEHQGESMLCDQDVVNVCEFPSLFLPQNPRSWQNISITFATDADIARIQKEGVTIVVQHAHEEDFFYRTEQLLNPEKKIRHRIKQFEKTYAYEVAHTYHRDKIVDFYERWKRDKNTEAITFAAGEEFFIFCVEHLDTFDVKQVYVTIDGVLVGLAWGVEHQNGWIGLHLKVDRTYKGLSRFLHQQRAMLFKEKEWFSLGTGAFEKGITAYKKELHPQKTIRYSYVLTGRKEA